MYEVVPKPVRDAQRDFDVAQSLLGGQVGVSQVVEIGWHGSKVHPLVGCFAVVRSGSALESLIGEIVRVTHRRHSVFVLVVGARAVPVDLSLARSVFWRLAPLYAEQRSAKVALREDG